MAAIIHQQMLTNINLNRVTRPARYWGGEWNSVLKNFNRTPIKFVLAYPDIYELGMSNLAVPILYEIINREPDALAERVFAPWPDMENLLRQENAALFSLESKRPLREFDIIGFSLGYELTYTNLLNMLDLAKIPLRQDERDEGFPLIIAGGSSVVNPEPMSDFIDAFVIGDGEEAILDLIKLLRKTGRNRGQLLEAMSRIPGFYVPSLFKVNYFANGNIETVRAADTSATLSVERRILNTLLPQPVRPIVPFMEVVHDRGAVEIQRGCSRGCRFCQAGTIYRPVRTRSQEEVIRTIDQIISNCGYQEIALLSLSSGDYKGIAPLMRNLNERFAEKNITISLPSLRLDDSSSELITSLPQGRKASLTFAPEAGSERLRYAMNKDISDDLIMKSMEKVFEKGFNLKLYFMIGLPTETEQDIVEITNLVDRLGKLAQKVRSRPSHIKVNVSNFVPKPHTACQWSAMEDTAVLHKKYQVLKHGLNKLGAHLSWHDPFLSKLEGVLSRGDRRMGQVIYQAWQNGCKLDAWREHFQFDRWEDSFTKTGIDPNLYLGKKNDHDILPWSHIGIGVSPNFLKREAALMTDGKLTGNCQTGSCNACGLQEKVTVCREHNLTKLPDPV